MVSSKESTDRILDAALALITRRKGADVTMVEIAKAARLSRQGVYLHFANRTDLMLALVRHAHEKLGAAKRLRKLHESRTGLAALRAWVSLQAQMNPKVWPVARSLEIVRRSDRAAEGGWQDRQQHRFEECRRIVARINREGSLKEGVTPEVAADVLWGITSLRAWEELVLERGWTATQYEKRVTRLLCAALIRSCATSA